MKLGVYSVGRILIVDDDQETRDLLCEFFQANGYSEVEAVGDGVAAREALARDGDCRVVIADLRMPNESGLDLLRNLRKENAKREMVLMSSFVSATERELARELGAYALLDKPLRLAELLHVISELMTQKPVEITP